MKKSISLKGSFPFYGSFFPSLKYVVPFFCWRVLFCSALESSKLSPSNKFLADFIRSCTTEEIFSLLTFHQILTKIFSLVAENCGFTVFHCDLSYELISLANQSDCSKVFKKVFIFAAE